MFPILPTIMAVFLCLTALEMGAEEGAGGLSLLALLPLAIIPAGEALVRIARRKGGAVGKRKLKACRFLFAVYPLLAFAAAVFLLGWPKLPGFLGLKDGFFLDKVILIASYLLLSNLTRFFRERLERAVRPIPPSLSRIRLRFAFTAELTLFFPFLILIFFNELVKLNDEVSRSFNRLPALFWSGLFVVFPALIYFMPRMVKWLWRLKPLPADTPCRKELDRFMEEQDFKVRDLLVWDTGGQLVNAAILGMTPKSRYIIFTDAMLRHLDLSEIKAVLAHELGHGKQKHLLLYLLFSMAFLFALALSENLLPPFSSVKEEIVIMLVLVGPAMILYWWLVFGFLSRRFETEADFVGALAWKDPELFIRTLDKVALVGRVERRRSSWRHFSIDRRTANLRKFIFEDPAAAIRFWRKMKAVRWIMLTLSMTLSTLFVWDVAVDTLAGTGLLAMENGAYGKAAHRLEMASRFPGGALHKWALFHVYLMAQETNLAKGLLEELTAGMTPQDAPEKVSELFMELGLAYLDRGNEETSLQALEQGLTLFPGDRSIAELAGAVRSDLAGNPKPLEAWIDWKKLEEEGENGHGLLEALPTGDRHR